jgi:hypothetical protein
MGELVSMRHYYRLSQDVGGRLSIDRTYCQIKTIAFLITFQPPASSAAALCFHDEFFRPLKEIAEFLCHSKKPKYYFIFTPQILVRSQNYFAIQTKIHTLLFLWAEMAGFVQLFAGCHCFSEVKHASQG